MYLGIFLAFAAYLSFSIGDASLKGIGDSVPIFETGFFVYIFAFVPAMFARRPEDTLANVFRPKRPGLLAVRMISGALGGILGVVAFTTLPLAETYALLFLMPLFVTVFSSIFLHESIGWKRWAAVVGGLLGVLLVVRPGFREVLPGHFAAIGVALCGAITVLVLRVLGPSERSVTLVGSLLVASIAINGILMLPTFEFPSLDHFPLLLLGGLGAGFGQLLLVLATRHAPAARVAPTQYSQIVWASLIGMLIFGEFPDAIAVIGMIIVTFCGLFTFAREERKTRWPRRQPVLRNR